MIDYSLLNLEGLTLHQVGNKHTGENNFVSNSLLDLEEESTRILLLDYFLKPFTDQTEIYQFVHDADISYNEICGYCKSVFKEPEQLLEMSKNILNHLFLQSNHPHIKVGELFVAYFSELVFEDEVTDAIGIFKAERKDSFFQFAHKDNNLALRTTEGVNPGKLDKGCLIINTEEENGYRVLAIDNNRYDAEYWKKHFLNIDFAAHNSLQTKQAVQFCKDFSNKIIKKEDGRKEQISFLQQSVDYLEQNENLDWNAFADTVFDDEHQKERFQNHKENYEDVKNFEFPDEFKVSVPVLNVQKKKIKSQINLDTNIQIKLNFNNHESLERFVEKGYDAERNMSFYKVYFNKETN